MASPAESSLWRLASKGASPIIPLNAGGKGWPLYLVHSISGDVTSLRPLAQQLGPERQVYGLQISKDGFAKPSPVSVHALATEYVNLLCALQPEGPFFLGGWSAGSFIALEMAQILKQRGREIPLVIALDGFLFKNGRRISAIHWRYYLRVISNLPRWVEDKATEGWGGRGVAHRVGERLRGVAASVRHVGRDGQPSLGVDAFLDMSAWPPDQARFVRVLFDTIEQHVPRSYEGPILVYSARTQHLFSPGRVEETWRKIAPRIELVHVDGTHVTMVREPRVRALASHLRDRLAELDGSVQCDAEHAVSTASSPVRPISV